ncbi:hypothetical protein ETAA8_68480 [Anatilimnocola aggregata]|uniref:Uncharacterized protein n=1 Tax=Anatilimnocola aggregata TaxID=2528021 RepID=A0A517YN95_9BACT|nr:hypothetical protein ETAA8_68480 [Anatilimnocola aggregata]
MIFVRALLLTILGLVPFCVGEEKRPVVRDSEKMAYLDNGIIKIGVDLDRGGSIGFLADAKKTDSAVNVHDLGRWIGQSYYSGPMPFGTPHPGWKDWPWNPVSAGDVYGNPSKLIEKKNDGKTLYIKSVPMQWALKNLPGDCQIETWITLEGRSVRVRNRLTNDRKDHAQYRAMDQELPAVYTTGKLHRLMTYTGDSPFADKPLKEIPKIPAKGTRPHWTTFFATEHWAALVDDDDWGFGVIHPDVVRFVGGFYGKPNTGGPDDDPSGYVAPVRQEILDHHIVYEYHYTLVLDSLTNIRKEAYKQRPKSAVPDYRFKKDRQHWWLVNANDTGIPVKDSWRLKVEQDDPQMFGPEGCWQAKDAATIFVRAAYRTTNKTAELFWESADKPGFRGEQSVKFAIVPDGKMRTYEVDLSSSAAYRGAIRRLRFDPVETGRPGETVDVEFISAKRD